jgi:hypothetical protein
MALNPNREGIEVRGHHRPAVPVQGAMDRRVFAPKLSSLRGGCPGPPTANETDALKRGPGAHCDLCHTWRDAPRETLAL